MGRPTVVDEAVVAKLLDAFAIGCTDAQACAYANISEATYYRHLNSNRTFESEVISAKQYPHILAKSTVVESMRSGNGKLALDWLKLREPENFTPRLEHALVPGTIDDLQREEQRLRAEIASLNGTAQLELGGAEETTGGESGPQDEGVPEASGADDVVGEDPVVPGGEPYGKNGVGSA